MARRWLRDNWDPNTNVYHQEKSDMTKKKEVAVVSDMPAYLQEMGDGYTGAERIDREDITIPRIKIAQAMTPEVKDGELQEGDLFLNVTGEVLAAAGETLQIIPILQSKEFILWKDRQFEGGGIFARAKPETGTNGKLRYRWDKQNETFVNKVKGSVKVEWITGTYCGEDDDLKDWGSEIPGDPDSGIAATAHHNYLVVLPGHGNMLAALSLSNSQVKKANDFNAMLGLGNRPIYARIFTIEAIDESNKSGQSYKNLKFRPDGFVPEKENFLAFEKLHKQFFGDGFDVDQSNNTEEEKGF